MAFDLASGLKILGKAILQDSNAQRINTFVKDIDLMMGYIEDDEIDKLQEFLCSVSERLLDETVE